LGELLTLATNDHPAALKLVAFSFGQSSDGPLQIVTEFIPNGTVFEALDRERKGNDVVLDATAKSKIIFGIVSAMASLHARGFLHHNLKPHNIFLDERFEPILGDFDCVRPFAGGGDRITSVEEVLYMAPEILRKDGDGYDFSIDVFSFAVTLYHIFADIGEFRNERPDQRQFASMRLRKAIERGDRFVKKPEIPEYHWAVIVRCWAQDPKARPTFQELLNEFHDKHEYILPGADQSAVLAYENQVGTSFGAPNRSDLTTDAPQE
jgi:serine/threonine protein kinase